MTCSSIRGLLLAASLTSPAWAQGADDCAAATPIAGVGSWPIDNTSATTDGSPDLLCDFFGDDNILHDIWFRWTAQASGDYLFEPHPSSLFMGHRLAVYADGCPTGPALHCSDYVAYPLEGIVAGSTYLIRVGSLTPGIVGTLEVSAMSPQPTTALNPANGHAYRLVRGFGIGWENARQRAEATTFMGVQGHLAAIQGESENQFAYELLAGGADFWWLGGFQDLNAPDYSEPAGGWRWVTGEPWSFTNWGLDGPFNHQGGERYLAFGCLFCPPATWSDYQSPFNLEVEPYGYIVEFETGGQCIGDAGTGYCTSGTNSVGLESRICAIGSPAVADDNLVLRCTDLPPGNFGMFFYGPRQVLTALGDGFRCVGGHTQRIPPIQWAGADGSTFLRLDFSTPPHATDFSPGATRYFQFWYRDGLGTSNLSDAVQVTFE